MLEAFRQTAIAEVKVALHDQVEIAYSVLETAYAGLIPFLNQK